MPLISSVGPAVVSGSFAGTARRSIVGVTVEPSVWMRRRSRTLTNAVLYSALAAVWGWMAVYLAILGHMSHTTSATRAFFAVCTVAMTALFAWVSVRFARSGRAEVTRTQQRARGLGTLI
jgi:hypothetical protein